MSSLLRARRGVSTTFAAILLVALVLIASVAFLIYFFRVYVPIGEAGRISVEEVWMAADTAGTTLSTVTVKNAGTKTLVQLNITVANETVISYNLIAKPLEPGRAMSFSPALEKRYIVGNQYAFVLIATFTDGSTFSMVQTATCQGVGGYVAKHTVYFRIDGVDSSALEQVLVVDGRTYYIASFPLNFTWIEGTSHSYEWKELVQTSDPEKRFVWQSTRGLSSLRIDVIPTQLDGEIVATYGFEVVKQVTFAATGTENATGPILTVDGINCPATTFPKTFVWINGSTHNFAWSSLVPVSEDTRHIWQSTSGLSTQQTDTLIVTQSGCINATYATEFKLTVSVVPSNSGNITLNPDGEWFLAGTVVNATTFANENYTFANWLLDGKIQTQNPLTIIMDRPHTLEAWYLKLTTIMFSVEGLSGDESGYVLNIDGMGYPSAALPKSFVWISGATHTFEWYTPVSARAGKRYVWNTTSGLFPSRFGIIIVPADGGNITAVYNTEYLISLTTTIGGTTTPPPNDYWEVYNTVFQITAVPSANYKFDHWEVNSISHGDNNPFFLNVNETCTVKAYFEISMHNVTFGISGLTSEATGVVLTVDGSQQFTCSQLPVTFAWVNDSTHTFAYTSIVVSSVDGKRFNLTNTSSPSPLIVNVETVIVGTYVTSWRVTFSHTALDSSAQETVVAVNGVAALFNQMPYIIWVNDGSTVSYNYSDLISSSSLGKRFHLISVTGAESPIQVIDVTTIVGNYWIQWQTQFTTSGLDASAIGVVVVVNGTAISTPSLPYDQWLNNSDSLIYDYSAIVESTEAGKRFSLLGVIGSSSPITISSSLTLIGTYTAQWNVTITHSGLDASATGTIVTVNEVCYTFSQLPLTLWVNNGSAVAYSYASPVASDGLNKRFVLANVSGPFSPATITLAITITGQYIVQWKVIFDQVGLGSDALGAVATVNEFLLSYLGFPYIQWITTGSTIVYEYNQVVSTLTTGRRYERVNATIPPSPMVITQALTVTGYYVAKWNITFAVTGLDSSATTVLTVNAVNVNYSGLPYVLWAEENTIVTYNYLSIVNSSYGEERFNLASITGVSSPINAIAPQTIVGHYNLAFRVIFNAPTLDLTATGIVVTINDTEINCLELPYGKWVKNGDVIKYEYAAFITSATGTKRFSLVQVLGPTSPATITAPTNITGEYITQWNVTLAESGLDTTATGLVVTVNSIGLHRSEMPYLLWCDNASIVTYSYSSTIQSDTTEKRFKLAGVTGPVSPVQILENTTFSGNYAVQWNVTFTAPMLDSTARGTVLSVNGTAVTCDLMPYTYWADVGNAVAYQYSDNVNCSAVGKRFTWISTTPESPVIAVKATVVVGNYAVQWLLKFTQIGLTVAANGTILTVDSDNFEFAQLPYFSWRTGGTQVSFVYAPIINTTSDETRFTLQNTNVTSPLLVANSVTVNAAYSAQWRVIYGAVGVDETVSGTAVTVNGFEVQYNSMPYVSWVTDNTGTTYLFSQYLFNSQGTKRFSLVQVLGPTSPATITAPTNITGEYITQWNVTFTQMGLDNSAVGTIVVVNTAQYQYSDLPHTLWTNNGSTITFNYQQQISSSTGGKRFNQTGILGATSPLQVTSEKRVIGNYQTQFNITFAQQGLDEPTVGTVCTIDGTAYERTDLPRSKWFNDGYQLVYNFNQIISSTTAEKRFTLSTVSGPESPIVVNAPIIITGNYHMEWNVTFTQIGLDATAQGTIVSVNGTVKEYAGLPYTAWFARGDTVLYVFTANITSNASGIRFELNYIDGPTSPITITNATFITGNYNKQVRLTVSQIGIDNTAQGVVVIVGSTPLSYLNLPFTAWYNSGTQVLFTFTQFVSSSNDGKRFGFDSANASTPILIIGETVVIGSYHTEWNVTFTQLGIDASATTTVVMVNGTAKKVGDLPFSMWLIHNITVNYSFESIVYSSTNGKRFLLANVTGEQSPITVTAKVVVTAHYLTQRAVTFVATGLDASALSFIVSVVYNETTQFVYYDNLPFSQWVVLNEAIYFTYQNSVFTSDENKHFVLDNVNATSPMIVSEATRIEGRYRTQWAITFKTTGLNETAQGSIITVNGVNLTSSSLPYTMFADNGSIINYNYTTHIASQSPGQRFDLVGIVGKLSPITVTSHEEVVGQYNFGWRITFTTVGLDSSANGAVLTVEGVQLTYGDLPYEHWATQGTLVTFTYQPLVQSTTADKRFNLTVVNSSSPLTISSSMAIVGSYACQWRETFAVTGLDVSAQGTIVVVNGNNVNYSTLPYSIWCNNASVISYSYTAVVSATQDHQFRLASIDGPASPTTVTSPVNITGNYVTQFKLSIFADPPNGGTTEPILGQHWYDSGTVILVTATPASGYPFDHWMLDGQPAGNGISINVTMNAAHNLTATFIRTFIVQFIVNGANTDASGTALTVDGVDFAVSELPRNYTWNEGSNHTFAWHSPLAVSTSKRYAWAKTEGSSTLQSSSSFNVTSSGTINATYQTQWNVTVSQTGLDDTTRGVVVTVDSIDLQYENLPRTTWCTNASTVTYTYSNLITSSTPAEKRFALQSTTGPSSPAMVTSPCTIIGNYGIRWNITLTQTGLGSDFSGNSVTFDGVGYRVYTGSSATVWVDSGRTVSYTWTSPISSTTTGKQYVITSTQTGSITVSSATTLSASYKTQYYLSVTGGNSPSGAGWYDSGVLATASSTWIWNAVSGQSRTALTNWQLDGSNQNPSRLNTGNLTTSQITMSAAHTVNFVATTQYCLTVTGGNSISYGTTSPTGDNWYDSGTSTTVLSNWVWNTVSGQSRTAMTNWQLDGTNQNPSRQGSGTLTTSSISMMAYHTVNFVAVTQYYLTVTGGNSITYGTASPTSDNWYDLGTSTTVSSNWVWNIVSGQSRTAINNYAIDSSNQNPSRQGVGTLTTSSVTMSTYHTVSFSSVTQYYLTVTGGNSITFGTASPTSTGGVAIRVQGNARGTTIVNSISVTMGATPTDGNVEVATIATYAATLRTVSSITQTGVTWAKQINSTAGDNKDIEIWFGVVGSGASADITIALSDNAAYGGVADVCEYSGLLTSGFLDKNATWTSNSNQYPDTGTTGTTAQADELWVGGICARYAQATPTDGFTLLDGALSTYMSNAYLEKIVSATGAAHSSTDQTTSAACAGCIATFKVSAVSGQWYDSGTSTTVSSNWVWNTVSGQSRTAITNWQLDIVNQNPTRQGSGTLTTSSVSISTYHAVNFVSGTQYYLTTSGGNGVSVSGSQTSDSWYDSGTSGTATSNYVWNIVSGQSRNNLYQWKLDSGSWTAITRANTGTFTTSSVTMSTYHTVTFGDTVQYYLIVTGGNGITYGTASPTSDNWYDSGTSTTVSSNGIYGRSGGTGTRVSSWKLDSGSNNNVATTGTVTTSSVSMTTYHTITFNTVTQYQVTLDSGATSALSSITSPTVTNDNYWYDSGTLVTLILNGVYSRSSGVGTRVTGYKINGGSNNPESTTSTFTVLNAISISGVQAITITTVTQYFLTVTGGNGITFGTAPAISGDTGWYDSGGSTTVSSNWVWNTVSGQSRIAITNWQLDGTAQNPTRSDTGNLTTTTITMSATHIVNFVSTTQYYLTVTGGDGITFGTAPPISIGGVAIRVQGNARGTSLTSTISVTLSSTPSNGHALIAAIACYGSGGITSVTSISETGVTWTKQVAKLFGGGIAEIWFGVVGSGASTSITVNLDGTPNYGAVANICEYSGLLTTGFLDQSGNAAGNGPSTSTGTTVTTTQSAELLVGCIEICSGSATQSAPTNGFTLLDGAQYNLVSGAYLEKIVSVTGTANSGTTISGTDAYSGVIATFKISAVSGQWYDSGGSTTVSSNWVWNIVSGQSRTAITNWQLDAVNQNPTRQGLGKLTTSSVSMSTYHAVNFVSGTQYYLTTSGGNSVSVSGSQTSDQWFDPGTSGTATSNYVWNLVSAQSRNNLYRYNLDGGSWNSITRANTGAYTTPSITMSTYHTVNFGDVVQYYLTVTGGHSISYGTTSPTLDNWYDTGTSTTISSDWIWDIVSGQSRYAITNYAIDVSNQNPTRQYSGTLTTSSITMSTYHTVAFASTTQYYFSVSSTYGSPTGQAWYDTGTSISSSVTRPVSGGTNIQYETTGWTGTGSLASGGSAGSSTTGSFTISAYSTCAWNWKTQYYLTMQTGTGGSVSPSSNWYDVSTVVPISATPSSGYAFNSWAGSGAGSYTGPANPTTITMSNPITETVNFRLWLTGWTYCKSHVINPLSGAGTNYQVKITAHYLSGTDSGADVYLNSHCRTDFGDVRFTTSDGATLLDYWMESYTASTSAVFWVEVAADLSTVAQTIYMYYGNSGATTTSNAFLTQITQLREHKCYSGYSTAFLFTNPDGSTLRIASDSPGGSGVGYGLIVVPRSWINGKYLQFSVSGNFGAGADRQVNSIYIYDGVYDRKSSTDFPDGSGMPAKGNGLLQTVYAKNFHGSYGPITLDVLINIGGSLDYVTIFFVCTDAWQSTYYERFDIQWIKVNTGAGGSGNIVTIEYNYVNVMELTGTQGDYGLHRKYVSPEPSHGAWGSERTASGPGGMCLSVVLHSVANAYVSQAYPVAPFTISSGGSQAVNLQIETSISDLTETKLATQETVSKNILIAKLNELGNDLGLAIGFLFALFICPRVFKKKRFLTNIFHGG